MKHFLNVFAKIGLIFISLQMACTPTTDSENKQPREGKWRLVLHTQEQEIPFLMELQKQESGEWLAHLINGEERILLDEVEVNNDSMTVGLHIFEADLRGKLQNGKWEGIWVKHDAPEPYEIPFTAEPGKNNRFSENPAKNAFDYSGKWEVSFKGKDGNTYPAVGVFKQKDNTLTGTFLTTTGDYRYLAGQVIGNKLKLSTFDGNHAWLFTATPASDSTIQGEFYSGKSGYQTWTAARNAAATLPDADTLTYLKPGYNRLRFSFPNLEGEQVSLQDERYKGKVVVVQLLGSWCPNCMDETAFLAPFYAKNKDRGVEVIGLGFERSPEFEKAKARLQKMKDRYNIQYDLLVAGTASKDAAAAALPALNHVLAFPTTILVDKTGKVRKIHTGFSGPGTGEYYEEFVRDFNKTINELLAE